MAHIAEDHAKPSDPQLFLIKLSETRFAVCEVVIEFDTAHGSDRVNFPPGALEQFLSNSPLPAARVPTALASAIGQVGRFQVGRFQVGRSINVNVTFGEPDTSKPG